MVRKMWRNWNCHTLLTRKKNGAATLGNHLAFPEMNKLKVTTWPNHSTFGIYPREMRTDIHTETYIQIFVVILSTPTKRWNNRNIHQQTNKQNVVYPYNGILCCHEKGWNGDTCYNMGESFIFLTWMKLETLCWDKPVMSNHVFYSIHMKVQKKVTETEIESWLVGPWHWRGRGWGNDGSGG